MVRPFTTAEVAEPLSTWVGVCGVVPMYGVIVYEMIELPLALGAFQLIWAWDVAGVALTPVGTDGGCGPVGVIVADGAEAGPLPAGFEAVTVNV